MTQLFANCSSTTDDSCTSPELFFQYISTNYCCDNTCTSASLVPIGTPLPTVNLGNPQLLGVDDDLGGYTPMCYQSSCVANTTTTSGPPCTCENGYHDDNGNGTACVPNSIQIIYNINGGSGTVPSNQNCTTTSATTTTGCTVNSPTNNPSGPNGEMFSKWCNNTTELTSTNCYTIAAPSNTLENLVLGNNNNNNQTNIILYAIWTGCPAGQYIPSGSTTCTGVEDGFYSPANSATETPCQPGADGSDGNRSAITDCYKNTTVANASPTTIMCHWQGNASTGSFSNCMPFSCNVAFFKNTDGTACDACPLGGYSPAGSTSSGACKILSGKSICGNNGCVQVNTLLSLHP